MPEYINTEYLQLMTEHHLLFIFVTFILLLIGLGLHIKKVDSSFFKFITLSLTTVFLCVLGYYIGALTIVVGVVVMATLLVGLILFDTKAMLFVGMVSLFIIFGSAIGSAVGVLPYSPMLLENPLSQNAPNLFWVLTLTSFCFPYIIIIFVLTAIYIREWRLRENTIRKLSLIDPLTEVENRRSLLNHLEIEVARVNRIDEPESIACIMIDLDDFKKINDTYGHQAGDKILKKTAFIFKQKVRQTDFVGRYGGEEFVLLLPNTSLEQGLVVAEKCRKSLENMQVKLKDGTLLRITGSFGISSNEHDMNLTSDAIIKMADEALYKAKEEGKNRCLVYDEIASKKTDSIENI